MVCVPDDLFSAPDDYPLAHCVSQDLHMSKGLAQQFKSQVDDVDELKAQRKGVGEVATLRLGNRNIYYLITKSNYYDKPTYRTLGNVLGELRCCVENNDSHLTMPRIGCGLDKLEWKFVHNIIKYIFRQVPAKVIIYEPEKLSVHLVREKQEEVSSFIPIWNREELSKAQREDPFCQNITHELETNNELESVYYIGTEGICIK